MRNKGKIKIAIIGAGSNFCPLTVNDILLDNELCQLQVEVWLMDISESMLCLSGQYAKKAAALMNRDLKIFITADLDEAVDGADFVLTAIEVRHMYYWAMDFHIPRKYGSNQIFGENGGPGGMFHFLRNIEPMLKIARTMDNLCPDAWLINYTNPEAKIIDALNRLTKIKCVGLCHGVYEGQEMLSEILQMPQDELEVSACGLNHFGWYQKIKHKKTGEDLYPLLKEKEREVPWLAKWDANALSRIMLRTYGLLPYPITNHIGEYFRWADRFIASPNMQYFYDPASESPWISDDVPTWVYITDMHANTPYYEDKEKIDYLKERFDAVMDKIKPSGEYGIPIVSAILLDKKTDLLTVNVLNNGKIPGLPDDMAVELPAVADGKGIHARQMEPLPDAVTEMIRIQGIIHKLITEAYIEKSRNKLLQAILLDPTVSTYSNSVAMINDMCEAQKEILPPMYW